MIGFRAVNPTRQPIYAVQTHRKLGYVATTPQGTFFQNADGKIVARILSYKQSHSPSASQCIGSSGVVPYGLGEW